jgi:RHS repeat-associated protein
VGTSEVLHYVYDAAGNLTSATDAFSALSYTYDQRNRVKTADNAGTPNTSDVVLTYAYDGAGNVLSLADTINGQAGGLNSYQYDDASNMTEVTQTGSGIQAKRVDLTYNAVGLFSTIKRYSDLAGTQLVAGTTYGYDNLDRLTSLVHQNAASATLASYSPTYNDAGQITQVVEGSGTDHYTYDNNGQLTAASYTNPSQPAESYTYDANGNRTASSGQGSTVLTGPGNRLLSDDTYLYTYDNEGNLITRTEIATGNVREYQWDFRNRLTAIIDLDASANVLQRIDYTYDAFNARISEKVTTAAGVTLTDFVYDRDNVLLDFVASGSTSNLPPPTLAERYLDGPAVDQVLAQDNGSGVVAWLLADQLGTTRDLVNNSGQVINHLTFDAFGNLLAQTAPTQTTRYLFTGREFDAASGIYYDRSRFYDPHTGRFLSEDPLGFGGGQTNLYAYAGSDPVDFIDPFGLNTNKGQGKPPKKQPKGPPDKGKPPKKTPKLDPNRNNQGGPGNNQPCMMNGQTVGIGAGNEDCCCVLPKKDDKKEEKTPEQKQEEERQKKEQEERQRRHNGDAANKGQYSPGQGVGGVFDR